MPPQSEILSEPGLIRNQGVSAHRLHFKGCQQVLVVKMLMSKGIHFVCFILVMIKTEQTSDNG